MKTVDVRLLVADDVDEEFLIQQLVSQSRGAGAPLGATQLVVDRSGRTWPSLRVAVRDGVTWLGAPCARSEP